MPQRYRLPDETTRPRGSHFRKLETLTPKVRVGVRLLVGGCKNFWKEVGV